MKDVILARLGRSLKDLRLRRGLTQHAAAKLAGLQREKVVRVEQGRGTIAIEAYIALAHALGAELMPMPVRRPTIEEISKALADE
jgi:HTH-type transcriptional regulator / antitoxin HipB